MNERIEPSFEIEQSSNNEALEAMPPELSEVIASPKYKRHLEDTWTMSLHSETETGFAIAKGRDRAQSFLGKIIGSGERDEIAGLIGKSINRSDWDTKYTYFTDLHTHPDDLASPSRGDLEALFGMREATLKHGSEEYPIMQIAAAPIGKATQQVDVLLLQEKPSKNIRGKTHADMVLNWLENTLPYQSDREDHIKIAVALDNSPYLHAELLSFSRNPKTGKLKSNIKKAELSQILSKFERHKTVMDSK